MKFEEALIKNQNQIININKIIDMKNNNELLLEKIKDDLYCPECGKAKLTLYLNVTNPFLKTKNNEVHNKNCSMIQPQLSEEEVTDIFNNSSYDELLPYMEKVLSLLDEKQKNEEHSKELKDKAKRKYKQQKRLPIKRIDRPLNDEDYNTIKWFYGNVNTKFDVVESEKGTIYWLNVMSLDGSQNYCNIKISKNVYGYLNRDYIIDRTNVNFVYLGSINKYKNRNYSTAYKSYFILIEDK